MYLKNGRLFKKPTAIDKTCPTDHDNLFSGSRIKCQRLFKLKNVRYILKNPWIITGRFTVYFSYPSSALLSLHIYIWNYSLGLYSCEVASQRNGLYRFIWKQKLKNFSTTSWLEKLHITSKYIKPILISVLVIKHSNIVSVPDRVSFFFRHSVLCNRTTYRKFCTSDNIHRRCDIWHYR